MTRIASHRGGTLEYGDSTPEGFSATARMPLEEVEFDLHPTRDGAIVVHHDATLDRTTDGHGALAALDLAEVQAARINYTPESHPLTLTQLCQLFEDSPVRFRCEIKPDADGRPYGGFVPRVVAELAARGRLDSTVFSSFLLEILDELALASNQPRLWLVSPQVLAQIGSRGVIALAKARQLPEIGVWIGDASAALQAEVQAAGLEFGCWGAHDTAAITKALDLGAKVFTTDRPGLAIALRAARVSAETPVGAPAPEPKA